jgi:hypothetical protein
LCSSARFQTNSYDGPGRFQTARCALKLPISDVLGILALPLLSREGSDVCFGSVADPSSVQRVGPLSARSGRQARSFKNCCLAGARQKDLRVQPLACGSFAKRAVVERAAAMPPTLGPFHSGISLGRVAFFGWSLGSSTCRSGRSRSAGAGSEGPRSFVAGPFSCHHR